MNYDVRRLLGYDCRAWLLVALDKVAIFIVYRKVDELTARLHICWILYVEQLPWIADQCGCNRDESDADFVASLLLYGNNINNKITATIVSWHGYNN